MAKITRHSAVVRFNHWLVALSGILLLFSGFGQMPMYKRYNIIMLPLLSWSGNYEITLFLHYLSAAVFSAAVFFHITYHYRRKEFGLLPVKGDVTDAIKGILAMLGLTDQPRHQKFQAKQKIIYLIIGINALILIFTGLVKSYKNLGSIIIEPMFLQVITIIHTLTAMTFLFLFLAHVAALMLRNHRPLIGSMIIGELDRDYADKHHPEWKIEPGN